MDKLELQKYLFTSAKDLAETFAFDLENFSVIENVVNISLKGQDKDGFTVRLDRKIDLDLIEKMIYPTVAIDEELFICRKIIRKVLINDY